MPDFAAAWNARRAEAVRDLSIPALGRADLIADKRAAGRLKDRADIEDPGRAVVVGGGDKTVRRYANRHGRRAGRYRIRAQLLTEDVQPEAPAVRLEIVPS